MEGGKNTTAVGYSKKVVTFYPHKQGLAPQTAENNENAKHGD